jgi:elongation factor Ts
MADITAEQVKRLRERTGAGMMDCKRALQETAGDLERAEQLLAERGVASVGKRAGRTANEGRVESYIHFNATVGSLVEINCETDFVANTDEFKQLAKDIALHVASPSAPRWLSREDVPASEVDSVRHIFEVQAKELGKPDNVTQRIVEGKMDAFFQDNVLLEQKYVKDDSKTVQQLLDEVGARTGEKVVVGRFARFRLGEAPEASA